MRHASVRALVVGLALHASLLPLPASHAQRASPSGAAWTRGATCYEIFVRSFADSDGDGIGDLRGLTARLDYLNDGDPATTRDLGARCIWLMPVMQSPTYHGYDATDYYTVEQDYGTNADFRALVAAAHRRGIRVLVDMVLNHSSDQHPWFVSAARDTASPHRDWYRWAPRPLQPHPWGRHQDLWHRSPAREEHYYGIFWRTMPDLNYGSPTLRAEMKRVASFWLDSMGVDGFRLDAIPYLVEEGTRHEDTPGTHAWLREWAAHVRAVKPDAWTVGEVWDSVGRMLPYYPDQLDAHFAFEVSDRLLEAVRRGDGTRLLAPVLRLQRHLPPDRWSPFLRNHDQPRTMTALGGDAERARLAATLLLTLPGVPFIYYGEEIGMTGDKPDERIRTPMQWRAAPGGGFTTGTPWQAMQADSFAVTVEAQDRDPASLLALHRRLIRLRDAEPAIAGGELVPLASSDSAVVAWARRDGDRVVVVVANLSTAARRGVRLAAGAGALPAGPWTTRHLVGSCQGRPRCAPTGTAPAVRADGGVAGWVPLPVLAPREAHVFALERARPRRVRKG